MREIPLTQGKVALVDDWWYDRLIQHSWYAQEGEFAFLNQINERTSCGELA